MSERIYIGARYVPVFATPIEWNSANTYEPLTIVLYDGNSYTSKQYVPDGIDITNETYWAQTGNYNAQIEACITEVNECVEQVESYDDRIDAVEDTVEDFEELLPASNFTSTNTVKKYVDDQITASQSTLETAIDATKALLPSTSFSSVNTVKKYIDDTVSALPKENFKNANIACIGDSWLVGYSGSSTYYSWADYLEDTGYFAHGYRYAQGGAGFYTQNNEGKTFNDAAVSLVTDHATLKDVDVILVVGGVNDHAATESDIHTGLNTVLTTLKTGFPDVPIYVGCNCSKYAEPSGNNKKFKLICNWSAAQGCIAILNLHNVMLGLFPYFTNDAYHLTANGYKYFGANILHFIQTGNLLDCSYYQDLTQDSLYTVASNFEIAVFDLYKTSPTDILLYFTCKIPASTVDRTEIATITDAALYNLLNYGYANPETIGNGTQALGFLSLYPYVNRTGLARAVGVRYDDTTHTLQTGLNQLTSQALAPQFKLHINLDFVPDVSDVACFS